MTAFEFPVSCAQERLLFMEQISPGRATYVMAFALRVHGALDLAALERAVGEIVRCHDVFRTTFATTADGPRQVVSVAGSFRLDVRDVTTSSGPEAMIPEAVADDLAAPFDLETGPLLRVIVARRSASDAALAVAMHHAISDGWSVAVFMRELMGLYAGYREGARPELPELPIQYGDYAVWQRQWLDGPTVEAQRSYWRDWLDGATTLELPADRERPPVATDRGGARWFTISPALAQRLEGLGRRRGATPFMTLLAAWAVFLHRYSGQTDVSIGTPVAGRPRPELEPLIGFFVNMLALRIDLEGDPTFLELLDRVKDVAVEAFAHQDLPFERVVQEVKPQRDPSRSPLFQAMFAFQTTPLGQFEGAGLTMTPLRMPSRMSKYDLGLVVEPDAAGFHASLEFSTDLFDASTMERWAESFQVLLRSLSEDAHQRISELPLLSDADRRRVLREWNETARPFPVDRCIHELFEDWARATPDATAIVFESATVSYAALNERAESLAGLLRDRGVRPEVLVGIFLPRSPALIVAMLAVLKAGGGYVCLEPSYPRDRLGSMVADAGLGLIVTERGLAARLPVPPEAVVSMDAPVAGSPRPSPGERRGPTDPVNVAYVLYTSGSTGAPKGVALTHRAVAQLVCGSCADFGPHEVVAQVASTSFDVAAYEIWSALTHGATLVIISRDVAITPSALAEELERRRVTVLVLTTSLFNLVAREAPHAFGGLNVLFFGGEAADPSSVQRVLARHPPRHLFNGYGPTECATIASAFEATHPVSTRSVPIGRPVSNARLYVLDARGEAVPPGVQGELFIGGAGLARGYWNHPTWTAERFVPDPFSGEPGARMYRTGDIVRHRSDGNLEFVGRTDDQVKIRGYRIEPNEVTAVLLQSPGVTGASVVAQRSGAGGELALTAYAVAAPDVTAKDLRAHLSKRLPPYMVPSAFVLLEALPLTQNGKIDRKRLPPPVAEDAPSASSCAPPLTPSEGMLASIWCELLGRQGIGAEDDFFEVGGHSLLATRLCTRILEERNVRLPLRSVFEHTTLRSLAARVNELCAAGAAGPNEGPAAESNLVLLSSAPPEGGAIFCVHAVAGGVGMYLPLAEGVAPALGCFALRATASPLALEAMAAQYVAEIRRVRPTGPCTLVGWSMGGVIAFEMARQLAAASHPPNTLVLIDPATVDEAREPADRVELALWMAREWGHAVKPDDAQRQLAICEANLRALRGYRAQDHRGKVHLLWAADRDEAAKRAWRSVAADRQEAVIPGDHYSILQPPNVRAIAEYVLACVPRGDRGAHNPTRWV